MEIVYYPDLYIQDEDLIKTILLFWGSVKTIIPAKEKNSIDKIQNTNNQNYHPSMLYQNINNEKQNHFYLDIILL
jgi:hypothetical protein